MPLLLKEIASTKEIQPARDPFQRVIGQQKAISLVKSAVSQRRNVLLCGVPGIGKSMIAKAAQSLLPPPKTAILVKENKKIPERPQVFVYKQDCKKAERTPSETKHESFIRPEELPFEIAVQMGFRCPRCQALSVPEQKVCMDCTSPKRSEWNFTDSYQGLLRKLSVISEPALNTVTVVESYEGVKCRIDYTRGNANSIIVTRRPLSEEQPVTTHKDDRTLVSLDSSRFVRVSGHSPVELLGDVKHDPYGAADTLAKPPHKRVVAGAIHEAHEGILYVDELAALGQYQKHLLTALQEKTFPILGHNPHSSGASIRVDAVPCDFILFASCNPEDLERIIPPLRSRIRGYGYEIMLNLAMEETSENKSEIVKFAAQTIYEDGRIPHASVDGLEELIDVARAVANDMDGHKNALTLRLRELGGVIRVAGDLAVQDGNELIDSRHVKAARELVFGLENNISLSDLSVAKQTEPYGDYFF